LAKSILIIDDEVPRRSLQEEIFEYLNYEVHVACNGKEGIESCRMILSGLLMLRRKGSHRRAQLDGQYIPISYIDRPVNIQL
jgi:CheY-like chemotaxis protein